MHPSVHGIVDIPIQKSESLETIHKVRQHFLRWKGGNEMMKVDNMRERGVKNQGKSADVLYGRPPS